MSDIATSIYAAVQRAIDNVIDSIATEGVGVLTKVLENEGFLEFEYLKDFQVFAHVKDAEIWFEIVLSMEGLDDESKAEVQDKEPEKDELPPENAKVFTKNELGNIGRVVYHVTPMKDARKPARDARRNAFHGPTKLRDTPTTSEDRQIYHAMAAHSPRSLLVNRQGQISIIMKSMVELQNSGRETFTYRHKKFEGAIGRFIDKLTPVISEKFSQELQSIITRYVS